jgi:LPS O-antigen subunit length determinant protein (WzzB/FepE family)
MLKCLNEYKAKYKEFEKLTNKSKQGFKNTAKEVTRITQETNKLQGEKTRLTKRLGFADTDQANAQIESMQTAWELEKANLI